MLSATMPYEKKFAVVSGKRIAYLEEGTGDPIVLAARQPHFLFPVAQCCARTPGFRAGLSFPT